MTDPTWAPASTGHAAVPGLRWPLAVACHDAGATNLILPWLDPARQPVRAWLQGPAERLWRARFGSTGLVASLDEALAGAAMLLSGTGWASGLEHQARRAAAARGLPSVAVIDHWVNYAARFEREGCTQWPDEVWVTDDDALAIARATLPPLPLRLQANRYLQEQLARIGPCPDPEQRREILVVLEPARSTWGRDTAGEFQALDHLVAQAPRLGLAVDCALRLRLRPHPSDPAGKYDAWMAAQRPLHDVELDDAPTLDAAIGRVAWVAGCETMAMAVALAAGRRVLCTLPPWAPPPRLPQRGLIHLRHLDTGLAHAHGQALPPALPHARPNTRPHGAVS